MSGLKTLIRTSKAINMENKVSYKQLKKAYLQAAKIVALHGEKYLPIFERLEKEYKERKKQVSTLNRAIKLAQSGTNTDLN
ncbi:MAG: hypothetical protein KAT04_06510 [Methylococcales bacterium]|nr:hypothetical protein [Methylococcales bacterium]